MPRKPRYWIPGGTYHITARGHRKSPIFYAPEDYQKYLRLLKETHETYPFLLHAYCLIPNHVHLLIETLDFTPSVIMKLFHMRYAIYFNKKYDLLGSLFQERFSSKLVATDDYFLNASRYIHRNPLDAEMVNDLASYRWSSYPAYLPSNKFKSYTSPTSQILTFDKTLQYFARSTPNNRSAYQAFVEDSTNRTLELLNGV